LAPELQKGIVADDGFDTGAGNLKAVRSIPGVPQPWLKRPYGGGDRWSPLGTFGVVGNGLVAEHLVAFRLVRKDRPYC